jgi:hypothetical protein
MSRSPWAIAASACRRAVGLSAAVVGLIAYGSSPEDGQETSTGIGQRPGVTDRRASDCRLLHRRAGNFWQLVDFAGCGGETFS